MKALEGDRSKSGVRKNERTQRERREAAEKRQKIIQDQGDF